MIARRKHLPLLTFNKYILRETIYQDNEGLFEFCRDPEVMKCLAMKPLKYRFQAKLIVIKAILRREIKGLPIGYSIIHQDTKKMIGYIDFRCIVKRDVAEVGYMLAKEYWNQGIMSYALSIACKLIFLTAEYKRLILRHIGSNIASRRVGEKNEFVLDRIEENGFYNKISKKYEDVHIYMRYNDLRIKND